jgi:hypothetical protein
MILKNRDWSHHKKKKRKKEKSKWLMATKNKEYEYILLPRQDVLRSPPLPIKYSYQAAGILNMPEVPLQW